ncbi:flagella biosynthesis regulator Flk [Entomohabitans teleogrylli]|uniref:flagella biosynthesis regulator Flk n=1 Tax=Entomohabitans teleogrylli TaxID=1384589 RepID=UPI00073D54A7|nr:flagella biosynthesis regulator Flk [Entomohabitans teleogrylli]
MQSIPGPSARPPGVPPDPLSPLAAQPLSSQQRTTLERLVTRIIALSQQQSAEVWAGLKHHLTLKNGDPLLSRHFAAAEQYLNQRLLQAEGLLENRQTLHQLSELLQQGNNRQAVSDYIRQQFGHTVLSQLSGEQLKNVLALLRDGQLTIPQPQPRPATGRPLLPAEHHALNTLVTRLAAATGESPKQIWQSMLELSGAPRIETISAKYYALLASWLQARHSLTQQSAPTLHILQSMLKQPLESGEWRMLSDYLQQQFQATPQTALTPVQIQDVVNHLFLRRAASLHDISDHDPSPIAAPVVAPLTGLVERLSARPLAAAILLLAALVLLWLVL